MNTKVKLMVICSLFAAYTSTAIAQSENSITKALECRALSLPATGASQTFTDVDLPLSIAASKNPAEIKSRTENQGEDGKSTEIKFKKQLTVFGQKVVTAYLVTDINGVQQVVSLMGSSQDTLKNTIERELSIKFTQNQNALSFFNATTGVEYVLSKDESVKNGYYFSCGLNSQLYEESVKLANEAKEKAAKAAADEQARIAKEEYAKQLEAVLAQNNKAYVQFVEWTNWANVYGPAIGLAVGLLIVSASGILLVRYTRAQNKISWVKMTTTSVAVCLGILLCGLSIVQYRSPIYKVESTDIEVGWLTTAQDVRNNQKYINAFLDAGEILANRGSFLVTKELQRIYSNGTQAATKNAVKAQYYEGLTAYSNPKESDSGGTQPSQSATVRNETKDALSPAQKQAIHDEKKRENFELMTPDIALVNNPRTQVEAWFTGMIKELGSSNKKICRDIREGMLNMYINNRKYNTPSNIAENIYLNRYSDTYRNYLISNNCLEKPL